MRPSRRPFAGRTDAIGFVLDPAYLDPAEISRRVVALWSPGASLRLADGKPLVLLRSPVSVRAEKALGLPVEGDAETILLRGPGSVREVSVDSLPDLEASRVIDVSGLAVEYLEAAPVGPIPPPEPMKMVEVPRASFRKIAGVGEAGPAVRRQISRLQDETGRGQNVWANLIGRKDPSRLLGRRNVRYVERLSKSFRDKDWERALSSAIGLGGLGGRGWAVRLPNRGRITGPSRGASGGGPSHNFSGTLQQHLRQLYQKAAEQLEADGEILLAAFVHADLLNDPHAAVELVERHGDFRKAAELAEGWIKDPATSVRLWWRAGDRERAIDLARARGAFGDVVARLQKVDLEAANELRAEWVTELQRAGDHLGAAKAAWPATELRDRVLADLGAVVGGGGTGAGTALAYLLEHRNSHLALDATRDLLDEPGPARNAFLTEFADRRSQDPATDREIATMALLSLVKDNGALPRRSVAHVVTKLKRRADPLVVADSPRITPPEQTSTHAPLIDLTDRGTATIFDAVAVSETDLLVALGERGIRLVGHDGRIRGEWDVPTFWLAPADHGRRVLLVTPRGDRFVVHELDLPNGRPRLLPALPGPPLSSYDGVRPIVVGADGIQWLEEAEGRWKVVWRELTEGQVVHDVQRSATSMAVAFREGYYSTKIWQWELPGIVLRQSESGAVARPSALTSSGRYATLEQHRNIAKVSWFGPAGHRLTSADYYPRGEAKLLASGDATGLVLPDGRVQPMTVFHGWDTRDRFVARLPLEVRPILRCHQDLVTVGHTEGKIAVIDLDTRRVVMHATVDH